MLHDIGIWPPKTTLCMECCYYLATGPAEGKLEEVWGSLNSAAELLAIAPDDELLAEAFALQSELLQQLAINRAQAAQVLKLALQDIGTQLKAASQKQLGVEVAKAWIAVGSPLLIV